MDKVSVIIPTWNRSATLLKAIQSALLQGSVVEEVLVCDDGSTDNSEEVIRVFNHPDVKWVSCGRNGRPSIPRNIGISKARGEWVAFLDSDDEWIEGKLNAQLEEMRKTGTKASCTNARRVVNGKIEGQFFSDENRTIGFEELLKLNKIICSSVLIHKSLVQPPFQFPEGPEHKAIEDYALWLRIAMKNNFSYLKDSYVNYTDEPIQSVRNFYTDVWEQRKVIMEHLQIFIETNRLTLNEVQKKQIEECNLMIQYKGKLPLLKRIKNKLK